MLAGGPPDRERALGMTRGVGEPVQVELGAGEVDDGIQLAGELGIGEPVDQPGGAVTRGARELRGAGEGEAAGGGRRAGGLQQGVADAVRQRQRPLRPAAHRR